MTYRPDGPPLRTREEALIEQRGHCLYCELPLDSFVFRNGHKVYLSLQWDHFIPLAYLNCSPRHNWAAACQVCNSIKSDLIFESVQEAREYISDRRKELGYGIEEIQVERKEAKIKIAKERRLGARVGGIKGACHARHGKQCECWRKEVDEIINSQSERLSNIDARRASKGLPPLIYEERARIAALYYEPPTSAVAAR